MGKKVKVYFEQWKLSAKFRGYAYWVNAEINPSASPKMLTFSILSKDGKISEKKMDQTVFFSFENMPGNSIADQVSIFRQMCDNGMIEKGDKFVAYPIIDAIIYDHVNSGKKDLYTSSGQKWSTTNSGMRSKVVSGNLSIDDLIDSLKGFTDTEDFKARVTVRLEPYVLDIPSFKDLYEEGREHLFERITAERKKYQDKADAAYRAGDIKAYNALMEQIAGTIKLSPVKTIDDIPDLDHYDASNPLCQHIFGGSGSAIKEWTKKNLRSLMDTGSLKWRLAIDKDFVRIKAEEPTM